MKLNHKKFSSNAHTRLLDLLDAWAGVPTLSEEDGETIADLYQEAGRLGNGQDPTDKEIENFVANEVVPFILNGKRAEHLTEAQIVQRNNALRESGK